MKTLIPRAVIPVLLSFHFAFMAHAADSDDLAEVPGDEDSIIMDDSGSRKLPIGFAQDTAQVPTNPDFIRFNAQYNNQWQSSQRSKDGKIGFLYGAVSKSYTNGPENAARSFLKETHTVFGLKGDLSDLRTSRVDTTAIRDHVRFQQVFQDIPVLGAEVLVHSNKQGQVTMVQNGSVADLRLANKDSLTDNAAKKIARDDINSSVGGSVILAESKTEKLIAKVNGSYKYIWKIVTPTHNPLAYWIYHIDAETNAIVYKANEILSLKSGKGKAYKTNANWHIDKISKVPLKNMYTIKEGNIDGLLLGLHTNVYDFNGDDPASTSLSFLYDPIIEKDYFDATHSFYQMNTIWDWWNKNILKKYSLSTPDYFYDIPTLTVVNWTVGDGECNAFYHPALFTDGMSFFPGFAFGDEDTCLPYLGVGNEDFSNDVDILRHEFTHAIMDWSGFDVQFGGELDGYGRSMGEGNADWYAFLYTPKDPLIGDVAFASTAEGYLRNLDSTRMYPRDVDFPVWGTPEEHYTGEIWGGYLYDLYKVLKKKAIPYVYRSSYYFSSTGGHRNDYPDFFDGILAQSIAEVDLTGKSTSTAKAWGAWASRGINGYFRAPYSHASDYFYSGSPGSDDPSVLYYSFPPTKSIKTKANLLLTGDKHEYVVNITEPLSKLTAAVKAATSDGILSPEINLYDSSQVLAASGAATGNTATITLADVAPGLYVFIVTGQASSPARGNYSFQVKIKK